MNEVLVPVLILAGIALLAGILLTIASKVLFVKTDERVTKILDVLPMANCGACGFAGCEDYAKAVSTANAELNLCKPGGVEASGKISEIMGKSVGETIREVAFVRCNGNCDATGNKYNFIGEMTCASVKRFYGGMGKCNHGCDGLGDCKAVCDYEALEIVNGVAIINENNCVACTKCVTACPNNLIVIRKAEQVIDVRCKSKDIGKIARQLCKNACIACKICEKKCNFDAIKVVDNFATIDYNKCTLCGECVKACPTKCIYDSRNFELIAENAF